MPNYDSKNCPNNAVYALVILGIYVICKWKME